MNSEVYSSKTISEDSGTFTFTYKIPKDSKGGEYIYFDSKKNPQASYTDCRDKDECTETGHNCFLGGSVPGAGLLDNSFCNNFDNYTKRSPQNIKMSVIAPHVVVG